MQILKSTTFKAPSSFNNHTRHSTTKNIQNTTETEPTSRTDTKRAMMILEQKSKKQQIVRTSAMRKNPDAPRLYIGLVGGRFRNFGAKPGVLSFATITRCKNNGPRDSNSRKIRLKKLAKKVFKSTSS